MDITVWSTTESIKYYRHRGSVKKLPPLLHLVSSLVTDTDGIVENNSISYSELKGTLHEHFCGTEYNYNLESKLRTLAWTKKINTNLFNHNLKVYIKEWNFRSQYYKCFSIKPHNKQPWWTFEKRAKKFSVTCFTIPRGTNF